MKKFGLYIALALSVSSCKQEALLSYDEQPRVYFNLHRDELMTPRPGSFATNILVDFAPKHSDVVTDTLLIRVQASGPLASVERSFDFKVLPAKSDAVEGIDYKILNEKYLMPAGKNDTIVRLVMLRSDGLKKKQVQASFRLTANEHFELGPIADTTLNPYRRVQEFKVRARDIVLKPTNWESFIQTYFGVYSEVRYRFVIDVLGKMEFPSTTSASTMRTNKTKLVNALNTYNATNEKPLTDEFGQLIIF
ncbi:DUF4843 domain-containing protein [Sphingobacterium faecale]|uniref:DUF4843 domain-containing protein n=1 Tax=Sphingobacterium faecale TaxID=2803775 RepID=A0ABS1R3R6_9SPHI|nr:DUF4843 domain-containing protein [Sphingobacterium faecale]MBL1408879.1 DUF4843 domain-containing protein [Sphingobacterium faecale]